MADATLKVTQYRSAIGSKPKQRGTLRALGLGKIGRSHELPDRPEIRGMLARVPHLVKVEEVAAEKPAKKAPAKKAAADKAVADDTAEETDA
ncbi:MAG: 50S ribosomal protein L30 [Acidimicrobiales bacterium]|nr:50S ribosomal protein L30 [Acidimicrobiales bacterium]